MITAGDEHSIEKLKQIIKEQQDEIFRLKFIIDSIPGSIYWKDTSGKYLGANKFVYIMAGINSDIQIIGKTDSQLPWADVSARLKEIDTFVMQSKKMLQAEEKPRLANGKEATFLSQKTALLNKNGEVEGVLGVSMDITELKRAQENEKQALQKSAADEATKRALMIFSGMSTHDLRTPLSSINLRAAFLKKYMPALLEAYKFATRADLNVAYIQPKVLEDLPGTPEDIMQGVREANEYIDISLKSLKGASQGEELISEDQLSDCNVERLLQRITQGYPYKAGEEALLHCNTESDFNFKGNVIFFNRLIENLIKNAFEQIELKGKGEIFIECIHKDSINLLKIKDTAGGVTQEIVDQLFNGIKSTKEGGTGIGLSSAKQIMHGMKGDIECHLVDGDCIEFVLSFPSLG